MPLHKRHDKLSIHIAVPAPEAPDLFLQGAVFAQVGIDPKELLRSFAG